MRDNPIIYIDVDSTINDHWRRIIDYTVPKWPNGTIDKMAFVQDAIMKDKPLQFAAEILGTLKQTYRCLIYFLTARNFPDARRITKKWLEQNGFSGLYKNILIVPSISAKVKYIEMNRPDIVIDDFMTGQENSIPTFNKEIAHAIEQLGVKVIVFQGSWFRVSCELSHIIEQEK